MCDDSQNGETDDSCLRDGNTRITKLVQPGQVCDDSLNGETDNSCLNAGNISTTDSVQLGGVEEASIPQYSTFVNVKKW